MKKIHNIIYKIIIVFSTTCAISFIIVKPSNAKKTQIYGVDKNGVMNVPYINQHYGLWVDGKWEHTDWPGTYFEGSSTATFDAGGCGFASSAMAISYCLGEVINVPDIMNRECGFNGLAGNPDCGVLSAKKYGLKAEQLKNQTKDEVAKQLLSGNPVMVLEDHSIFGGGRQHYILLVGYVNGEFAAADPSGLFDRNSYLFSKKTHSWNTIDDGASHVSGAYTVFYANSQLLFKSIFDYDYYTTRYPEIKEKFGDDEMGAFNDFMENGLSEGRVASPVFDINYYMEHNPDLKELYKNDYQKYCTQFMKKGMKEGRRASEDFRVFDYKELHPELEDKYGDDLPKYYIHYVEKGWKRELASIKPELVYTNTKVTQTGSYGESIDEVMENANSFVSIGNTEITQSDLQNFSQIVYNIILSIGIVTAVLVGALLGIRFMTSGVEEKAETKALLVPYLIGCVVVFGAFAIWKLGVTVFQIL